MRASLTMLLAVLLAAPACGVLPDPWPGEERETLKVEPGETAEGTVVLEDTDDEDDDLDAWRCEESVHDLPPGFGYETTDVLTEEGVRSIDYEIEVAPWVDPGWYEFRVDYEFWPYGDPFREEYRIEFEVRVRTRHGRDLRAEPLRIRMRLSVSPETQEVRARTFLEVG